MTTAAERTRPINKRGPGLRELRLVVPDARSASVRKHVAAQVARLDPRQEDEALGWIETVSDFDAPDTKGR